MSRMLIRHVIQFIIIALIGSIVVLLSIGPTGMPAGDVPVGVKLLVGLLLIVILYLTLPRKPVPQPPDKLKERVRRHEYRLRIVEQWTRLFIVGSVVVAISFTWIYTVRIAPRPTQAESDMQIQTVTPTSTPATAAQALTPSPAPARVTSSPTHSPTPTLSLTVSPALTPTPTTVTFAPTSTGTPPLTSTPAASLPPALTPAATTQPAIASSTPTTIRAALLTPTPTSVVGGGVRTDGLTQAFLTAPPVAIFELVRVQTSDFHLADEYVVLANFGPSVSLSGWSLSTADGRSYDIPDMTLQENSAVRVHTGTGAPTRRDVFLKSDRMGIWNNTNVLYLRDEDGVMVDRFELTPRQ